MWYVLLLCVTLDGKVNCSEYPEQFSGLDSCKFERDMWLRWQRKVKQQKDADAYCIVSDKPYTPKPAD